MNHFISLSEAIALTTRYRANREEVLNALYRDQNVLPLSEHFERSAFDQVLAQDGCAGLRIYYGMDKDYKVHAVIVGTDAEGKDLLPATGSSPNEEETSGGADDLIIERGIRCPALCPEESPLNSEP